MNRTLSAATRVKSPATLQTSTIERIENYLSAAPIVLFMKGTRDFPQCGFSAQVVSALRACNAEFLDIDILGDFELRENLKVYSQWPTIPQLYISRDFMGGCDIVMDMYASGELLRAVRAATF
jgi:monothiol glutaredoxin